jgi:small-conductance mechanosensitive channel
MAGEDGEQGTEERPEEKRSGLWRWLVPVGWILAIGAAGAAVGGYVALAAFVTQQTVRVGFLLGALYILLVLADEAIQRTFDARSRFGVVMTRSMGLARETVEQIGVVLSGLVRLLLLALAALFILAPIGIDGQDVVTDAKIAFFGFKVGGLTISLSSILTAIVFLVIGIAVTRGVQGWLDQRFLPRTRLDVGLKNSIRTSFGYLGIVISVALAFSVIGLDLQNLAIVAGALSVGVGFGLQSIVNNFVSGLILLVERPIKSGDLVELGAQKGFVRKINVRSTEIETFDRASLIVPNSSLITGNVKNWMHRDLTGRCLVDVGVSYDTDPAEMKSVLLSCAERHDKVLKFPAPVVLFTNFGADALEFRLICTIGAVTDVGTVESDLRFDIVRVLREKGIEIPSAQRDINIRQLGDIGELLDRFGIAPAAKAPTPSEPQP